MLQTELPKSNRSRRRGRFDDELLFEAIAGTTGLSAEFVGVAEEIARRNDRDAALRLFHGFEALIQQSGRPPRAGGVFRVVEFDTTKFLGHELFTSFTAVLMKHQRMELLGEVLNEGLVVDGDEGYATKTFAKLSARVRSLHTYFSRRGQNWISASGALLKERHSATGNWPARCRGASSWTQTTCYFYGPPSTCPPIPAYFLQGWTPWSYPYLAEVGAPEWVSRAESRQYLSRLCEVFGGVSAEEFRKKYAEHAKKAEEMFQQGLGWPLKLPEAAKLGSRP